MNKKIAMSAMSIFSALTIMGGATFAFFSDPGTSTANTFANGDFDLKLTDNNEVAQDTVSATWSSSNMAPGVNPVSATLGLKNDGTIAGDNVHLRADSVVTDNTPAEDQGAMDSLLEITSASYDGGDILPLIPDANGNGLKDVGDLSAAGDGPEIGKLQNLGVDHSLAMTIRLWSGTNNTYQNDSVSTTFTVTLHQDASQ